MLSRRTFIRFCSGATFGVGIANLLAACAPAAAPTAAPTAAPPASAPTAAPTAAPKPAAPVAPTVAPTTVAAASGSMDKVKFQLRWVKNIQFGGFFAALDKGFYKDEGLDVEILGGGPNINVLQVVTGGGANIGYGVFDDLVRARAEQGLPVTVFGANYQTPPVCFMSRADNPVKSAQDFVGKKLAITNGSRPTFEALMTHNGVDPSKVNVIPAGVEPTAMATGEVDIYHGFSTNQGSMLEQQGIKLNYLYYQDLGFQTYDAPLFAMSSVFQSNEDVLVRFLRGSIKGWEYNNAHTDEVAEIVVNKYGIDGLELDQQKVENKAQAPLTQSALTDQKGLFWMTAERWKNAIDFLVEAKSVSKPVNVEEIMSTKILEKAYAGKTKLLSP